MKKILSYCLAAVFVLVTACSKSTTFSEEEYKRAQTNSYDDGFKDGYKKGEEAGIAKGYDDGYKKGVEDSSGGYSDGYSKGKEDGYSSGYSKGEEDGYAKGQTDGYSKGKEEGYSSGYSKGEEDGYAKGQTDGYNKGFNDGTKAEYEYQRMTVTAKRAGYSFILPDSPVTLYVFKKKTNSLTSYYLSTSSEIKEDSIFYPVMKNDKYMGDGYDCSYSSKYCAHCGQQMNNDLYYFFNCPAFDATYGW